MFFKSLLRLPTVCCIMGFVVGVFFAIVMPPIIIAVIEGILLALLCLCILCK